MEMKPHAQIRLIYRNEEPDCAYLELRDHPHELAPGIVKKTVALHDLIESYDGPSLYLDFDVNGRAIGVEIVYPSSADDDEQCSVGDKPADH